MIVNTPTPPYYAVIFTSELKNEDIPEYHQTAKEMIDLAREQDGFIGIESARDEIGISVSYWKSIAAIQQWKSNVDHLVAKDKGKSDWYKSYKTRISLVEREY